MKKTIGLMLSTSILLGLTACGGGGGDSSKGEANTPVDPAKLTYDGKKELLDLTQLDDQKRKELADAFVDFYLAHGMTESVGLGIFTVIDTFHAQKDLHGLTAGQQLSVDYKNIEDYCGGTGTLKVSSDFNENTLLPRSYLELRADAGTLEWKLNNLCAETSDYNFKLTADLKETYRSASVTSDISLKLDVEADDLKNSCEYKMAAAVAETELGVEFSGSATIKCLEAVAKMTMDDADGDITYQLKSGEKAWMELGEKNSNVVSLSSYGKFGYLPSGKFKSCYDTKAKVNRIKSGNYYLWTVSYDQNTGTYTIDPDKAYLVTASQPDSMACGKPNVTVVKEVPQL